MKVDTEQPLEQCMKNVHAILDTTNYKSLDYCIQYYTETCYLVPLDTLIVPVKLEKLPAGSTLELQLVARTSSPDRE